MILFQRKHKKFLFHKLILIFFISFILTNKLFTQPLTLAITGQDNTICGGSPCNYTGPTILINEVMLMPDIYDGCIFGTFSGGDCEGEWIELYNPNACNSVDISCYFLGNCAKDGFSKHGAGFALPVGTIVPPLGFCIVRGVNAPSVPLGLLVSNGGNTVEVVVEDYPARVCLDGGNRLWFPNAGGWFAFYDGNGVAQDAIKWATQADMDCNPCNPGNCAFSGTLAKGNNITNVTNISGSGPVSGQTFRRIPDGSAWDVGITAPPTYGICNSTCADPVIFTCDGEATVSVLTGTPPYTYLWDNGQIGQTAIGLCAGQHCVTVTDANGSNSICIDINEPPPPVVNLNDTAICSGNSIILDAENPGSAYEWNTGGSTQTIIISLAGNYSVTVTDINNCIGIDSMIATISPNPTADAGVNDTICNGFSTGIGGSPTASGGTASYTYLWDNAASLNDNTIANPTANPVVTTTYTVTITDSNGCTDTDDVIVTINPNPVADAGINDTICNGFSTGIGGSPTASGGTASYTYLWDNAASLNDNTIANPTANPVVTTTYTVTITDSNGCTDTDDVIVTINPNPVADAGINDTICNGFSTGIGGSPTASGGTASYTYLWDNAASLNDNTIANPTANPVVTTIYTVTITDSNGCTDTDSVVVSIYPTPVADAGNDTSVCSGSSIVLTASGGTSYSWNTGDATASITVSPAVDTTYIVTVTDDGNGCTDVDSVVVTINSLPVSDFSYTEVCLNDTTYFTDISNGSGSPIVSWDWDFDDGNTSTNQNPSNLYLSPGNYNVSLIVVNSNGCRDTITKNVIVDSLPVAGFVADTVCLGYQTGFTDTSLSFGSANVGWDWDFGDGNISTNQNPSNLYLAPGNHNVSLIVVNANGCRDTITKNVIVDSLPVSDFSYTEVCLNDTTYFTDLSDGSGVPIASWDWDFDDGNTSTNQNPSNLYLTQGNYNVSLIVVNSNGCKDTITKNVIVDSLPVAGFIADTVCFGYQTSFTDASLSFGSANVSWDWDFDDGNTSTNQNPSNLYLTPGTHTVQLIVTNQNGCSDTIIKNVIVDSLPVSDFSYTEVCLNDTTYFTDLSDGSGVPVVGWDWDFGDGNTSTNQNPYNLYLFSGNYNVSLIIANANGCRDTITKNVVVDSLPVSIFDYTEVCLNDTTYFTDMSDGSGVPVVGWDWDFDDGNTSTDQNPSNLYLSPGNYNVSLIVVNANGCRDTIAKNVAVDSLPVAGFVADTVCLGYETSFTDTSLSFGSPNVSWLWDFGDGNTSTDQNPIYVFTTHGLHTVQLVIINQDGCTDIAINTVVVDFLPVPNFSYTEVCLNDTTYFTDMSNGSGVPIVSWLWDFGDGNTSTDQNPCNLYLSPGNHSVSLSVINTNGCTDTIIKNIVVDSLPIPDFSYEYTCLGDITYFTDMSYGAGALVVLWDWNFGDGNTSTVWNPSHLYLTEGDYNVSLVVVNSNGCIDSITKVVTIDSLPVAGFIADAVCLGEYTVFTDTSLSFVSSNILWDWNFGDGDTSIIQNPVHIFITPGSHTVQLIVTNQNGCKDTTVKNVVVDSLPIAGFVADTVCLGYQTSFTDTSLSFGSPNVGWDWNFGDGGTSTEQNPSNLYLSSGLYPVQLIATNQNGCKDTIIKNVIVDSLPVPDFSYASVCLGDTTYFTDMSDGAGALVVGWDWDFGDGDTSVAQNPSHLYSSAGNYNVLLIVTNSNGCIDSITKNVSIYPYPVANFSFTPTNGCEPLAVQFTDFSIYVNNYYWDFGDSTTSTEQNPLHIYQDDGIYSVTLYVVGDGGCSDTLFLQDTITVYPNPNADFDYHNVNNPPPNNGTIQFTNLTTGAIIYDWDLGDGSTSTEVDPNHRYDMYGTYLVTLIATTEYGCKDTVEKEIGVDFFKGLFIPNAFCPTSPYPEVQKFIPKGFGIKEYHIVIYDTWGNLLWESSKLMNTEPAESWDGYYKGKLLSPDVYVWKVRATFYDESTWKGKKYDNGVYRKSGTVTIVK